MLHINGIIIPHFKVSCYNISHAYCICLSFDFSKKKASPHNNGQNVMVCSICFQNFFL